MGVSLFNNTTLNKTETHGTVPVEALMHEAEKLLSNKLAKHPNDEYETRLTQMEEAIKLNLNKMLESKIDSMNGKDVSTAHTMWGNSTKKHEEQQVTDTKGLGHQ